MLSRLVSSALAQAGLDDNDVFSLQALLALRYGELDALALFEVLEPLAPDGAIVDKYVAVAFTADKAKAL